MRRVSVFKEGIKVTQHLLCAFCSSGLNCVTLGESISEAELSDSESSEV